MNKEEIQQRAQELEDQAEETVSSLKERAMQFQRTAKDGVVNAAKNTDNYVHDNPWAAIGITAVFAFGLGLLVGIRRS